VEVAQQQRLRQDERAQEGKVGDKASRLPVQHAQGDDDDKVDDKWILLGSISLYFFFAENLFCRVKNTVQEENCIGNPGPRT
jgi:hypothetical protein